MSLLVYPGFGESNLIEKQRFLISNLSRIKTRNQLDVMIFSHSDTELDLLKDVPNLTIKYEKGIIGEFLYRYITPEFVDKYSNIIISMDDVELLDDVDIDHYISKNIDIISPCLSNDSKYTHEFMLRGNKSTVEKTHALELFFYVMSKEAYKKYYSIFLDENVSWLWYIDCVLELKGFSCAIDYTRQLRHHYEGSSKDVCSLIESIYNRDKLTINRQIIQIEENLDTKNNNPDYTYRVFNPEQFMKENYEYIFRQWELIESWDKYLFCTLLYIYHYGGIYMEGRFKDISPVIRLLEDGIGKDFVLGKHVIIGKRHSENILNFLLHKRIKNPSTFAYLDDVLINQLRY